MMMPKFAFNLSPPHLTFENFNIGYPVVKEKRDASMVFYCAEGADFCGFYILCINTCLNTWAVSSCTPIG
jgi:hypothetical protein